MTLEPCAKHALVVVFTLTPLRGAMEAEEPPSEDEPPPDALNEENDEEKASSPKHPAVRVLFYCLRAIRRVLPKRPTLSPFDAQVRSARSLRRLKRDFLKFDIDSSGSIDVGELCQVFALDKRSVWTQNILQYFDTDNDGKITFEEFVTTLGVLELATKEAKKLVNKGEIKSSVAFVFAIMDHDGNKMIDRAEFSAILWEYERRKEREFGKLKHIKMENSSMNNALGAYFHEKYIADQRAERREFLRQPRMLVKSAILYLSNQCSSRMSLKDFQQVYEEFPDLFSTIAPVYKKKFKFIMRRCAKLLQELQIGIDDIDTMRKEVIEGVIKKRIERERERGRWDWAQKLGTKTKAVTGDDNQIVNGGLDEQAMVEIAQISRLLKGEKVVRPDESEFLSSFSFCRDGSFQRKESRRVRGPRASGRGRSATETFKMRARQISREPPRSAAEALSALSVSAQKEVVRLLTRECAVQLIAHMGQIQRDVLLSSFKHLVEDVEKLRKQMALEVAALAAANLVY